MKINHTPIVLILILLIILGSIGPITVGQENDETENGVFDKDVIIATIANQNSSPTKPIITGVSNGTQNVEYTYTIKSIDADNDTIKYTIDWGDQSDITISAFLENGTAFNATHTWKKAGIFTISVTATDNETESEKATFDAYIDIVMIKDDGYLIDIEGDGKFDSYYNTSSNKETELGFDEGIYLIDENGNNNWDYSYNSKGELEVYFEKTNTNTPGFEIIIIFLAISIIFLRKRINRQ